MTENRAEFDRQFSLRDGEAARIGDDGPVLRFERVVEDARCAVGNACVIEGDAVVLVALSHPPDGPASLELHTSPDAKTEGTVRRYRVRLIRLEPRPIGEQPVPLPRYWATFVVSK